jgi:hypothetical protein
MCSSTTDDLEVRWKLLGREMGLACQYMNSHFRCAAGAVRFTWLLKHSMFASIYDGPRLVIGKGTARESAPKRKGQVGFATHLYSDENILLESYVLTIDEMTMCGLTDAEPRVAVREMCRGRLLKMLCTPCTRPTLI